MTINDFKKAIEGVLKGWHDKFDNLTSRPTVAELSDIAVDTPAFRSYGEVIDLSGKEYVVGRVIAADGSVKNLYQRSFHQENVSVPATVKQLVSYADWGVDQIIDIFGSIKRPDGWGMTSSYKGSMFYYNYHLNDGVVPFLSIGISGADVGAFTALDIWFKVLYTKTTD